MTNTNYALCAARPFGAVKDCNAARSSFSKFPVPAARLASPTAPSAARPSYPRFTSAEITSASTPAGDAAGFSASMATTSSLSFNSTTMRSAVFLPTPGIFVKRTRSPPRIAGTSSSTLIPLKIFSASVGPTPEAESSISKKCFSRADTNPYSASASSRTCVWIRRVTSVCSSPSAAYVESGTCTRYPTPPTSTSTWFGLFSARRPRSWPIIVRQYCRFSFARQRTLDRQRPYLHSHRSAAAQKFGDLCVATLLRKLQGRFPVIGPGAQIRPVSQEHAYNPQVAIRGGSKKRRVAGCVAVIRVGAICQKPRHSGGVSAGYGAGQGVIARPVGCHCANVCAFRKQVFGYFEMPEHRRQRNYGKTVGRVALRLARLVLYEEFHALQLPERRRFMQLQRNSLSQQHIAKLLVPAVHRQQQGRLPFFITDTRQFWFGGQHPLNCCGVPCLNDFEKLGRAAHTCASSESTRSAGKGE